jgi:hypothetical protein
MMYKACSNPGMKPKSSSRMLIQTIQMLVYLLPLCMCHIILGRQKHNCRIIYLQSAEKNPFLMKTGTGGKKTAISTNNQSFACMMLL